MREKRTYRESPRLRRHGGRVHLGPPAWSRAAGFHLGRDTRAFCSRPRQWKAGQEIRTVYRRVSRPVAKRPADEREPSGFPLIHIHSDLHHLVLLAVAEAVHALDL